MSATCLAPVRQSQIRESLGIQIAERLAAAVILLAISPALTFIAVVTWLLSGRSPLVAHLRVGHRGRPLWVFKYRTMWDRPARNWGFRWVEYLPANGSVAKSVDDPRVTSRFARFCRRHSLDELPQLLHVARGEMSFVGPRPITSSEIDEYYRDHAAEVLSARPGLTGLWQIRGRNRLTYRQRLRLDLFLVRRGCASLYFRVLLATLPRVLTGKDAW
ncbi:MAG TPA: sugar transferase [Bryobacteraceae bacterium]|nr:sugar transferase [Bryobacteraceae bacterium]